MQENRKLIEQLKRHEGARRDKDGLHIAYRCTAGALTIGYGHNLDANPVPGVDKDSRLTEDQAERLLAADVKNCCRDLDRAFPFWNDLDDARRGVMVNMAFNLGIGKMRGFTSTLGAVGGGRHAEAANYMLASLWASQVGKRAEELARQMESGVWS